MFSPAKVNLFLEVTAKRADGYHELETLFAKLNFGDELDIAVTPAPTTSIDITVEGPLAVNLPPKEQNLVWRAADGFFKLFDIRAYCSIKLFKVIPMGAGLGGGSSNAGTTLKFLAKHYNKSTEQILPLAAKLGADVALFIYNDAFMLGAGIGEVLTPVKTALNLPHIVVANPGEHISTASVFGALRLPDAKDLLTKRARLDKILVSLKSGVSVKNWGNEIFNRLEEGVLTVSTKVRRLESDFKAAGAEHVMMSGSGSSVFGLFEDYETASASAKRLRAMGYTVFNTTFGGVNENKRDKDSLNG